MRLPSIDGREIVPVRLIPIITNGWLAQQTLAKILANRLNIGGWPYPSDVDEIEVDVYDEETETTERITKTRAELLGPHGRDNGVAAYHFDDGSTPVKMRASEWDVICREIGLLEPVLRELEKKNGVPQSMESIWRLKATKILPPGVFLWREDMDSLWKRHTDCYSCTPYDPPDFRKGVNYNAYIRPEYKQLVCEGFEHLLKSSTRKSNLPDRMGMKLPKEKRRKEEDFTRVIKSLFNQLMEEGNTEILQPGNPTEFLKCLKKRMEGLDKMKDACTSYGELILWVKPTLTECVKMQNPRIVKGSQKRIDKPYCRTDVSRLLAELRNEHRDRFPLLPTK